jgi:Neurotransmitter-gated ion-channel ligand binding domain
MSMQLVRSAETPALIQRSGSGNGPTQVSVGIWIVDINNIDSAQQNFTADIAIVLRWKDARLAHTGTGAVHYGLDQIWTPRVSIANETNSVVRKLPESAEVEPDGTVLYRQRYVGSFTQPLRLQSFPFDRQSFRIQFVAIRYRPNEVVFVADENWIHDGLQKAAGISRSITLPDWTVERWDAKPDVYALTPGLQYSGYVFEFTASRNVQHYILKVILPLILIVMMSWSVFWTEPTNSNTQFSIAVTSMLTLIAYRFAVDTQLPRLPYMTRLDVFFLFGTLLVFLSLIEVLVTTILDNNDQVARAKKLDRYCRVIVPVIFVIATIAIFAHPRG